MREKITPQYLKAIGQFELGEIRKKIDLHTPEIFEQEVLSRDGDDEYQVKFVKNNGDWYVDTVMPFPTVNELKEMCEIAVKEGTIVLLKDSIYDITYYENKFSVTLVDDVDRRYDRENFVFRI